MRLFLIRHIPSPWFYKAFPERIKPEAAVAYEDLPGLPKMYEAPDQADLLQRLALMARLRFSARFVTPEVHAGAILQPAVMLEAFKRMFENIRKIAVKKRPLNVRWSLTFLERELVVYRAWRVLGLNRSRVRFDSDRIWKIWRSPVRTLSV